MPTSSTPDRRAWVLAAPRTAVAALAPLIEAHRGSRPVVVIELDGRERPPPSWWRPRLIGAAALLRVGDRALAPQQGLPAAWLRAADRRIVPAGWLPNDPDRLPAMARAAAAVQRRSAGQVGPVLLLGPRQSRYREMADELAAMLRASPVPAFRWTAERVMRPNLLDGLCLGAGAALYCGHGTPAGWSGYAGVTADMLRARPDEPLGAVLSICCATAMRYGGALSFAEELVLRGCCGAVLAAAGSTLHARNRRLASALCRALTQPQCATLGDLLLRAIPAASSALARYRIIGDPLASMVGAPACTLRAAAVPAPDPDMPLTPVSLFVRPRIEQVAAH